MIVEFKVKNFRSIQEEQVFSMVAAATKSKPSNVFEAALPKGDSVRLLRSAVIYGANASGKSNFLRAFYTLRYLVTQSNTFKLDKGIPCYEPFLLDTTSGTQPTRFECIFIGTDNVKYNYTVEFDAQEIITESLSYFPKGQEASLYVRAALDENYHTIVSAKGLEKRGLPREVLKNQLILSRFGSDPHVQLNKIWRYFDNLSIGNALDTRSIGVLVKETANAIQKPENQWLRESIIKLVQTADTGVQSIQMDERPLDELKALNDLPIPEELKERVLADNRFRIIGKLGVFEQGKEVGQQEFDFRKNMSAGTNAMFGLGGMFLQKLKEGGIVIFDELDNSLHPKVTRFLIQLFHNPMINKANAQIIFSTHEPLLMDKQMFRSDQIWLTEKSKFGATELYSAQDFDGVREDAPFDKWYMAGKFGALPQIQEVSEFSF